MKTIFQGKLDVCPVCFGRIEEGTGVWHHIFNGTANRKKCDEDQLLLYCHPKCHEEIHAKQGLDLDFKMRAMKVWCQYYDKPESEFIKRYGKNYREAFYYWQKHHD